MKLKQIENQTLQNHFGMLKKIILSTTLLMLCSIIKAQDVKPFAGEYYNEEYQIILKLDIYDKGISVPDQEIYGELPGYFSTKRDSRLWLITGVKVLNEKDIELSVINDYGSEDFTARFSVDHQGNYTLKHLEGSTYKIVVNSKYVKIPKSIIFKRK